MKPVIAVGSVSRIKMQAVSIACRCVQVEAEIVPVAAGSGVRAQPVGIEETGNGARNRAEAARKERPDAWAIGIESGIMRADNGEWIDMAAIALIDPDGRSVSYWSDGLPFPAADVEAAIARGPDTTVGEIISARTGCAADDPHFYLTGQERSRLDYLADAIERLFRFVDLNRHAKKETP